MARSIPITWQQARTAFYVEPRQPSAELLFCRNVFVQKPSTPCLAPTCGIMNLHAPEGSDTAVHMHSKRAACILHLTSSLAVQQNALGSGRQQICLCRPFDDCRNVLRTQQPQLKHSSMSLNLSQDSYGNHAGACLASCSSPTKHALMARVPALCSLAGARDLLSQLLCSTREYQAVAPRRDYA